jgi:Malectin domain
VPSTTAESTLWEAEGAELQAILHSPLFARSPTLSHLLSYLCEKKFSGEADQIKEYSVAIDVFDRAESFDQDTDSIVRVRANRLRKRLSEYYAVEGASHPVHITIPVGQYVPEFARAVVPDDAATTSRKRISQSVLSVDRRFVPLLFLIVGTVLIVGLGVAFLFRRSPRVQPEASPTEAPSAVESTPSAPTVGLPVGEEIHILAGSSRKYVDHAGKLWIADKYFAGGTAVSSAVQQIWRTQDPIIYRTSRQGDFSYDIPLQKGIYELHLHFAETFYGPENPGGEGEGSRMMTVAANGTPVLRDLDVLADSGGGSIADVRVFRDIFPDTDGQLHLKFSSTNGGRAMVSAIEILPGLPAHLRPVRILARDVPYYSNDSRWWSPDTYFKGGRLSTSQQPAEGTDDPEFYASERWGHFSYAIPVAPGRYTVTLYFIEHHTAGSADRAAVSATGDESSEEHVFDVFCNGRTVIGALDIVKQAGEHHPLIRKIKGLEPNAQGKLLLEFVPVTRYATVTGIEVVQE